MQELMDPQAMLDAVTFIHQTNATSSGTRWAIWMTGVGAGLAQKLFSQSGASATLYDFQVPYSNEIRRQMVRNEGYAPSQRAVSR